MAGPIDGVRVFDLTVAGVGPFATMILATLGANVVKVEPELQWPPARQGGTPSYHGLSVVYMNCHLGKRGINLDLKSAAGKEVARTLLRDADVFVENMSYGAVQRLGLSYDDVAGLNPDIVYGNFPGWGDSGPYVNRRCADTAVQAFAGVAATNGRRGGDPELIRWYALYDFNASSYIAFQMLLGLLHKQRTGKGLRVLGPQVGATIAVQTTRIAEFLATGQPVPRMGSATTSTVPHRAFLCEDKRWLAVGVIEDGHWERLCRAIGATGLLADAALATNRGRVKNREAVDAALAEIFEGKPAAWWEIQLRKAKVPVSRFLNSEEVFNHPQVLANELFVDLDYPRKDGAAEALEYPSLGAYPEIPTLPFGRLPIRFSKTPTTTTAGMLPGAHTTHILEHGWGAGQPPEAGYFGPAGAPVNGILDGVTVVDMTQGIAGPYASLLLAESGARVIKIEPRGGDYVRGWEPSLGGVSAAFTHLNRNKEGLSLDIESEDDLDRLKKLLGEADVFIEEEGQSRLSRYGLDHATLREINPRLITCSISAFGTNGPLRDQPASELVLQAMSDYLNNLGAPGEEPVRIGADMASSGTSLYACHGILAALYHQWRTGEGQLVEVNQLATLIHQRALTWTGLVDPDAWSGFLLGYTKPPDYPYKTADQPIMLGGVGDRENMIGLMKEIGLESHLDDPLFKNPVYQLMGFPFGGGQDPGDTPYLAKSIWEKGFQRYSAENLVNLLDRFGSRSVVVNDYEQMARHPQTKALDVFKTAPDGTGYLLPAWKLYGFDRIEPAPYRLRE